MNKSSMGELWQRFSYHPWPDEQKLYMGTLARIFLPSLDWRMAKIFLPSLDWRMAKIFLPSLDWRTKALCKNIGKDFPAILGLMNGKDFPAILGLTNKSSTWELWQRFSWHPWTDEQKLYVGTLAKIFLPSLDWWTKALRGNFGKDFPAILGLMNKSSTWELWQRFSCHPWTDEQKLYMGTLAKIFLPSLDCWTKALCGNIGKDFSAILGLRNKSSMWELWQRFSCHPWTEEQKLYIGTLAKIFLPSLDCQTKTLRGNIGKDFNAILRLSNGTDFPAILGLSNKSSMLELWQRFSCHPWTDEEKLYVGTLAKIFLKSLDWRTKALRGNIGKDFPGIFLPSLDWNKSSIGNFGKDFPAILGLTNKSYMGTLAKNFLPSLDWRTKALRGNFGKDFPAIVGLKQKLYVGTLAKIFLPSMDWWTKALRGNFGKDFPAILGLTNKSSTLKLLQRFSCHPWTDEW